MDGEASLTAPLDAAFVCNLHSQLYNYLASIIQGATGFDSFVLMPSQQTTDLNAPELQLLPKIHLKLHPVGLNLAQAFL